MKRTIEEVYFVFQQQGLLLLETEYRDNKTPLKYRCFACNYEGKIRFNNVQQGCGCINCAGRASKTLQEVKIYFSQNGCELLEDSYVNSKTPMKYRCVCGRLSKISWNCFSRGSRCRKCCDEATSVRNKNRDAATVRKNADLNSLKRAINNPHNTLLAVRPDIALELDELASGFKAREVTCKSGKRGVWRCSKNAKHELWSQTVHNRVLHNSGCPHCVSSKKQRELYDIVKKLHPDEKIEFNYWHPALRFKKSGRMMQLDIYLPELQLALEYQGEFHWDISAISMFAFKDFEWIVKKNEENWARDEEKREACKQHGIKLIELHFDDELNEDSVKKAIAGDFKIIKPKAEIMQENGIIKSYRVYFE